MGHYSVDLVHGVTVIVLCISSDHGLYLYQVSRKYFEWFQSNGADTISILINTKGHNGADTNSILINTKGHNSVKQIHAELQISADGLIMVYICTKFHENILNDFRVMERKQFQFLIIGA